MLVTDWGPNPLYTQDGLAGLPEGSHRPRGVLVADDDEAVRQLLLEVLHRWGYAVWAAEDGFAAVSLFHQVESELDLLILDVRMPRLDGPQSLAAIRESGSCVPCCFISGDLGQYSGAELADLGGQVVLAKPFRPADLANAISGLRSAVATTVSDR